MKIESMDSIKELLELMQSHGVDRFKVGDIEVHFSPGQQPTSLVEPTSEERRKMISELLKTEDDDQDAIERWST